jgi:hypothetical protein
VVIMRHILDTSAMGFTVTKAPEPRRDYGKTEQRLDKGTGRPEWVVEVLAMDSKGGVVIRVTVAGDQPRMTQGQAVHFEALEAIPWNNNGKSGVAYRAASVQAASSPKAA